MEKVQFKWKQSRSTRKIPAEMEKVQFKWKKSSSRGKKPTEIEVKGSEVSKQTNHSEITNIIFLYFNSYQKSLFWLPRESLFF